MRPHIDLQIKNPLSTSVIYFKSPTATDIYLGALRKTRTERRHRENMWWQAQEGERQGQLTSCRQRRTGGHQCCKDLMWAGISITSHTVNHVWENRSIFWHSRPQKVYLLSFFYTKEVEAVTPKNSLKQRRERRGSGLIARPHQCEEGNPGTADLGSGVSGRRLIPCSRKHGEDEHILGFVQVDYLSSTRKDKFQGKQEPLKKVLEQKTLRLSYMFIQC